MSLSAIRQLIAHGNRQENMMVFLDLNNDAGRCRNIARSISNTRKHLLTA